MKTKDVQKRVNDEAYAMPFAEMTRARRPEKLKRVSVHFPGWVVNELDMQARRLAAGRQALIKVWLAKCLARGSRSSC